MNINFLVRFKNPVFIFQIIMSVLTPILAYFGLAAEDITSWKILLDTLLEAVKNPYVCVMAAIGLWNAINDPTTSGLSDSKQAMLYTVPKKE